MKTKLLLENWRQYLDEASPAQDLEFATAGGMEQDIEMRADRGDFEQGDYGNVGPGGGEMMDHGEYPWIKTALDDLKDEEAPNKEKALQALADELGISITMTPELEDKEEPINEAIPHPLKPVIDKVSGAEKVDKFVAGSMTKMEKRLHDMVLDLRRRVALLEKAAKGK